MSNSGPVILLLIEYSIIPIGFFFYNFLLRGLYSTDPITAKKKYHTDNCQGLELMVILTCSVLARVLSVLAHSDLANLDLSHMYTCLIFLAVFTLESYAINYFVSRVREWGITNKKSKRQTMYAAGVYWVILCFLIVFSADGTHACPAQSKASHADSTVHAMTVPQTGKQYVASIPVPYGHYYFQLCIYVVIAISIGLGFWYRRKRKGKRVMEDYNRVLDLKGCKDANELYNGLEKMRKDTPEASILIIDTFMKLSSLFIERQEYDRALAQVENLETTNAFQSIPSYLKDGVYAHKFRILLNLNRPLDAEKLISQISTGVTAAKLAIELSEYKTNNR